MLRKNMVTLLGAVWILGVASTASAMPADHDGGMRRGGQQMISPQQMAEQLHLTQAQRRQFKQIHRSSHHKMAEIRRAERKEMAALHKLRPNSPAYDRETTRLARALGDLRAQELIERSSVRAKVYAILTPEQREQARALRRQHHRHAGAMRDCVR